MYLDSFQNFVFSISVIKEKRKNFKKKRKRKTQVDYILLKVLQS